MYYKTKRTITAMSAGFLAIIGYIIYALGESAPAQDDLKGWALAMLIFIGVMVVVSIVIQIIFHVVFAVGIAVKEGGKDNEDIEKMVKTSMVEDERDKLIELKSSHLSFMVVGFGAIVALFTVFIGLPMVISMHIVLGSFALGSFVEGSVTIVYNEMGVRNG